MHSADGRVPAGTTARQQLRQQIGQRRWEKAPGARAELGDLLGVPHRGQPRRLFYDDDLLIDVAQERPARLG
jgi:hypothetical protein